MIPFEIIALTFNIESDFYAREGIIKRLVKKIRKNSRR